MTRLLLTLCLAFPLVASAADAPDPSIEKLLKKLDLTFLWARELRIRGSVGYGLETWRGERRHTFEIAHDLLVETGAPVQDMVTHVYPLAQYRDALRAAANHRRSGAVKVLLQP